MQTKLWTSSYLEDCVKAGSRRMLQDYVVAMRAAKGVVVLHRDVKGADHLWEGAVKA